MQGEGPMGILPEAEKGSHEGSGRKEEQSVRADPRKIEAGMDLQVLLMCARMLADLHSHVCGRVGRTVCRANTHMSLLLVPLQFCLEES